MGQCQLRVNIYINFVKLEYIMLHATFHDHSTISSVEDLRSFFTIYGHSGHLGHVISTSYVNFRSPFLRRLHMKLGFDWPSGFREEEL